MEYNKDIITVLQTLNTRSLQGKQKYHIAFITWQLRGYIAKGNELLFAIYLYQDSTVSQTKLKIEHYGKNHSQLIGYN